MWYNVYEVKGMTDDLCTVEDCSDLVAVKKWGYCNAHYIRWQRYGDPSILLHRPRKGRTCKIDGCDREVMAREWCNPHYNSWNKYGDPLTAKRAVNRGAYRVDDEGRECIYCKNYLPWDEYNNQTESSTGKAQVCRMCDRLSRYNITRNEYEEMLAKQDSKCAACGDEFSDTNKPNVDHDHRCCTGRKCCGECIRAILCSSCNRTLGNAGDDVARLESLITYLGSFAA